MVVFCKELACWIKAAMQKSPNFLQKIFTENYLPEIFQIQKKSGFFVATNSFPENFINAPHVPSQSFRAHSTSSQTGRLHRFTTSPPIVRRPRPGLFSSRRGDRVPPSASPGPPLSSRECVFLVQRQPGDPWSTSSRRVHSAGTLHHRSATRRFSTASSLTQDRKSVV